MAVNSESFARRFSRLREEAGLTKSALAAPRFTLSYVSQIESGGRKPSGESLAYFAQRLGVSPAYLESGVPDDLEDRLGYAIEDGRAALASGDFERALEVARAAADEAESFGVVALRSRALVLAGDALLVLGRVRESIDRYEEALEEGLSERERGVATAQLAIAYRTVGDLSYAIDLLESVLSMARDAPLDPSVSASLHSVLLSLYFERGDVTKAERVAHTALAAAEQGVSPQMRAEVLWSASRVLAETKQFEDALDLARQARHIIESAKDRMRLSRVHSAYAYLCLETDPPRLDEATEHLLRAETLLGADAPPSLLAPLYTERGRAALMSNDAKRALELSGLALASAGDDALERSRAMHLRGRALDDLGRYDEALDAFFDAVGSFEKIGARQQAASCYREIGEIDFREGKLEAAAEAFRAGLEMLEPRRSRA